MKAVVMREFGTTDVLQIEDIPTPTPAADEVLIKVHAVSINRTLDLVVRAGKYVVPVKLPHILGVDPSGEIVAVGKDVNDRTVGQRVVTLPWRAGPVGPFTMLGVHRAGGYAEYVTVPAKATELIPEGLGYAEATVVTRHAPQAFNLLRDRAGVKPGETVLVMGASGGLGSAGVQVAKMLGATVIAGAGTQERADAALPLGADHAIDYRANDLADAVLDLTNGQGANVVFENIGDPDLFPRAVMAMARHGRLVTAGSHGGGLVQLDVKRLYLYQLSILGSLGSRPEDVTASLQAAADGKLTALIEDILPLESAADAHDRVAQRDGIGKLILSPTLV